MSEFKSPLCSCIMCHGKFSKYGIDSHFLQKHTPENQLEIYKDRASRRISTSSKKRETADTLLRNEYSKSPKLCVECGELHTFANRNKSFCSISCSTTNSNRKRNESGWKPSIEARKSTSDKLIDPYGELAFTRAIIGEYTRIFFKVCIKCVNSYTTSV